MKVRFEVHGGDRAEVEVNAYAQARLALGVEPEDVDIVEMKPLAYMFQQEEPAIWTAEVVAHG